MLFLLELGRVSYDRALALQDRLVELRRTGAIGDTLLLLEHPPVLTLGRNAGRENIVASDEQLAARGIALHVVKRGGDVTYHGPGQLIGYPILDLREHRNASGERLGVVDYVRRLEEALIRTAGECGIRAQRIAGRTGVWTEPAPGSGIAERKLAAIGIHVSRGITSHGFALNISTDLRDFALIVPCGIVDRAVTSLAEECPDSSEHTLDVVSVGQTVARNLGRVFSTQVLAVASPSDLHPDLTGW
jgi:lipoyl(octanoyl) transferase